MDDLGRDPRSRLAITYVLWERMLLKWIVCTVPSEEREAFAKAQLAWRRIRYADGLIAQIGGFDLDDPTAACILAAWHDEASHGVFMRTLHEAVVSESGQAAHYTAISTEHYAVVSRMPGQRPRFQEALCAGRLLRVARCRVTAERVHPFVRAQLDVFTPGLASAKGMYGGAFAKRENAEDTFLSLSSWQDNDLHQLYVDHHLPTLNERAATSDDVAERVDRVVELEPHWAIHGVG